MTIYAAFFLPETKGVPLEEMQVLWSRHWFWGRFVRNTVRFRTSGSDIFDPDYVTQKL